MTLLKQISKLILCTTILTSVGLTASAGDIGVGANIGTDGIGVEIKTALSDNFTISGGYNYMKVDLEIDNDDIRYDGDAKLSNFNAFVNYHPFGNGFNISGGAYLGPKDADISATLAGSVTVGDITYTAAEVGRLDATGTLNDFAPYAGIGYDSFISSKGNWSFNAKLGVMFSGAPEIEMTSVGGTLSNNAAFNAELAKELASLEDEVKEFKYYPILSLGIARKF